MIIEQIKAAMKQQNVSQSELARRANLHRSRISKILQGNENLTLETIALLAKQLNLKINFTLKAL
jgi:transcriptional regulator with XRE-family HTH domain